MLSLRTAPFLRYVPHTLFCAPATRWWRWLLIAALASLTWIDARAQACTTGCGETLTSNVAPTVNNFSHTLCLVGAFTYTQNFDMNGGTVCIGTGMTFNPGGGNYNGNWTVNNHGTLSRAMTLQAGQTIHNYGTYTGALTLNGGTFINYNGATFTPSSLTLNNGTLDNRAGGTMTLPSNVTISSGLTLINQGTMTMTGQLTVNSGATVRLEGTQTIGSILNNGTIFLGGLLTMSGNFNQNSTGILRGASTSQCNYLDVMGTIQGQGTYDGVNGLRLSKPLSPACASCETNGTATGIVTGNTFQMAGPTFTRSGNDLIGTVVNSGGAVPPTHYIILRRTGAQVNDQPTSYVRYTAGQMIGVSRVVAYLPVSTTTFTDAGVLSAGCLNYHYAVFAAVDDGTCINYRRAFEGGNRSVFSLVSQGGAVSASQSICSGATPATLTLSGHNGEVLRWQVADNAAFTGATDIAHTGTTYTPDPLTANRHYRAVVGVGGGCPSAFSAAAMITVVAPAAPVVSEAIRCGPGTLTLNAVPIGTGQTIDWFDAATGGTQLATGSQTYTTPVLSANRSYFAQARHVALGCTSATRQPLVAVVGQQPTVTASGGGAYCVGSTMTLTASGTNMSHIYWTGPDDFFSRTAVSTITPMSPIKAGQYRVTATLPIGANRVVNGDFEAGNTGFTSAYTHNPTDLSTDGNYAILTNPQSANASFSACGDRTTGTGRMMVINGASTTGVAVWRQTVNVEPGRDYQFSYWQTSVHPSSPSQLEIFINGVSVGGRYEVSNVTCLWQQYFYSWNSGTAITAEMILVNRRPSNAGNDFALDDISLRVACVASQTLTVIVGDPTAPGTVTGAQRCGPGTLGLSAAHADPMMELDWFDVSSGGAALATNTLTYTTPTLTATVIYHVQARNPRGGCVSTTRTPVTATITDIPDNPVVTPAARCGPGSVTLTIVHVSGTTNEWFTDPSGGTPLHTGNSYITPSLSATTTYYVQRYRAGCSSPGRSAVTATINDVPADPPSHTNGTRCGVGSVALLAAAPAGATLDWFAGPTGGTALANGVARTDFNTPSIGVTTLYYAQSRIVATGCTSAARRAVTATVNITTPPTTTPGSGCGTSAPLLSATPPGPGHTIRWYDNETGGSILITSNTYAAGGVTATRNFWAEAVNSSTGCASLRTPAVATIHPAPTMAAASNAAVCQGTTTYDIPFTAVGGGADQYQIQWSAAAQSAGLVNTPWTAIPSGGVGALTINSVPSALGDYEGDIIIRSSGTGCTASLGQSVICATVAENQTFTLQAPAGKSIQTITFASYGSPNGVCGGFSLGACHAASTMTIVRNNCEGRASCVLQANNSTYGDPCVGTHKRLSVQAAVEGTFFSLKVEPYPTTLPTVTPGERCGPGTVALAAVPHLPTTQTIDWYTAPTGGTPIAGSVAQTNWTTPSLSTSTTYYAQARTVAASCLAPGRVAVQATITTPPSGTIAYATSSLCQSQGGALSLTPTGLTSGGTYTATPSGLSLTPATGQVNLSGSSAGSYTVTYTLPASGGCPTYTTTAPLELRPDVTLPTLPAGPAALCQGANPTNYTTTTQNATSWAWSVTGTGNTAAGTAGTGTITFDPAFSGTATVSVTAQGCGGPRGPVSATVTVRPTGTWLGTTNAWPLAANWCGGIPTLTTDVIIPASAPIMPQITGASFVRSLALEPGSSVIVLAGQTFQIDGQVSGAGTLSPNNNSTVHFSGGGAQTIPALSYGNLILSGTGTKTLTFGATTAIRGEFVPGPGPHVVTGSRVNFSGAGAQTIPGFGFDELEISGGGSAVKTLSGTVTTTGALHLTSGRLAMGSQRLRLGGAVVSGSGVLAGTCSSELELAGSGATGALLFASDAAQVGRLAMVKTGPGTAALGAPLTICQRLELGQGTLALGAHDLTLAPAATTDDGHTGSYVVTANQPSPVAAGRLVRELPAGAGARTFPVGTATSFTPMQVTNSATGATRTGAVRAFDQVYMHGTSGPTIDNLSSSVNRTWQIAPVGAGSAPNLAIRLFWAASDENVHLTQARLQDPSALYIGRNEATASSHWLMQPRTGAQLMHGPYSMTTSGQTWGTFAIGTQYNLLPVKMGPLTGHTERAGNRLAWATYTEVDAKAFVIEASGDGRQWRAIGRVAARGQSRIRVDYTFLDTKPNPRRTYYRVLFLGTHPDDRTYTNLVTLDRTALHQIDDAGTVGGLVLMPNPASGPVRILPRDPHVPLTEGAYVEATDARGVTLRLPAHPSQAHPGEAIADLSPLAAGVYRLALFGTDDALIGVARVVKH